MAPALRMTRSIKEKLQVFFGFFFDVQMSLFEAVQIFDCVGVQDVCTKSTSIISADNAVKTTVPSEVFNLLLLFW